MTYIEWRKLTRQKFMSKIKMNAQILFLLLVSALLLLLSYCYVEVCAFLNVFE